MTAQRVSLLCMVISIIAFAPGSFSQSFAYDQALSIPSHVIQWRNEISGSHPSRVIAISADDTMLARQSAQASIAYLTQVMDQYHNRFPVYDDVSSAGN